MKDLDVTSNLNWWFTGIKKWKQSGTKIRSEQENQIFSSEPGKLDHGLNFKPGRKPKFYANPWKGFPLWSAKKIENAKLRDFGKYMWPQKPENRTRPSIRSAKPTLKLLGTRRDSRFQKPKSSAEPWRLLFAHVWSVMSPALMKTDSDRRVSEIRQKCQKGHEEVFDLFHPLNL